MIAGIISGQPGGFSNWVLQDPATASRAPFVGGWGSVLGVFLVAGFAFQGTEGVGLAAAETTDPVRNVPKAIGSVFWRILLFYIGSIFVVGTLIPFNDPNLLRGDEGHVALSPYTIVFSHVPHIGYYAASLMNAVILTAVLSCGNSSMYVASRMLHAMAHSAKAPKACARLNARGVPAFAIVLTALVSALTFFSSMVGDQKIYQVFYNASSLSGFHDLAWDRHLPSALPQSLDRAGSQRAGSEIQGQVLSVRYLAGADHVRDRHHLRQHERLPDRSILMVRFHHRLRDGAGDCRAIYFPQIPPCHAPGSFEGL
jgi:amino acid permease